MTARYEFIAGALPERGRGQVNNTAYVDFAGALRRHPGEWAMFPPQARWPAWDRMTPELRTRRLNQLRGHINRNIGSFRAPGGRFEATVRAGDLYARWLHDGEVAA